MRQHKVYKHETKGYAAVKVGFAWYGLFFSFIWLIFKSLFFWLSLIAIFLIIFSFTFNFSENTFLKPLAFYSSKEWLFPISFLSVSFLVGFKGNYWVSRNLENKGYHLIQKIPSISSKEAIIQTQNEKSDKPLFAAWGKQDSYQPAHRHIEKEK
jgi:hypothetical protein